MAKDYLTQEEVESILHGTAGDSWAQLTPRPAQEKLDPFITYGKGYEYQLKKNYRVKTKIATGSTHVSEFIVLDADGTITILDGYAWDGPSGPAIDTPNFMRGSLVHDALYQLMREDKLDREVWRQSADEELQRMCKEDGMSSFRAAYVYSGVHYFAKSASMPENGSNTFTAP